ncbi:MAG: Trk system potassium transporter TrkA [Candidatus Eisenbacteria bacterium]|uniref:Trk system potassium uptake protein TrkA n=1 Tax=Eiseniibacteriota bacterium TaxID=2212470 RepID=A0A7Y2E5J0_UNCEI|nr:Trk system potassium transporter TrkA [Candidatus Eisenbacteria bacterium]
MRVIVIGAGEVGTHITSHLSEAGHDVVLIEKSPEKAEIAEESLNALVIRGNGASAKVLDQAGCQGADMLIAVTDLDEVNIVACVTGKTMGIGKRVARVKDTDHYNEGTGRSLRQVGVDIMINPDLAAALEIERLISLPGASDVSDFGNARVRLVGLYVSENSSILGIPLKEVENRLGTEPATVVAIVRDGRTIIPDGESKLKPEDHVFIMGESNTMPSIMKQLGYDISPIKNVMIVGAGPISRHLAKHLSDDKVQVKIIEIEKLKAERTAETLDRVMVLHGDATDSELLESESIDEMDALIAASNDEDTNVMACLLARHLGARKTISLMRRQNYVPLVHALGIDAAISVRLNTASAIMRYVRRGEIVSFAQLKENEAEALELVAKGDTLICKRPLIDVGFPRHAIIGAIIRGNNVLIPRGDTHVQDGDRVVVFALPKSVEAVEKMFSRA